MRERKGETTLEKVIARALLINQYQVVRVRFEGGTRQMARLYVSSRAGKGSLGSVPKGKVRARD